MKKVSVFDVTNYCLARADEEEISMTHLKLQKICYYAQAWSLIFDGEPLFHEEFQAWAHGPVCPELWKRFKIYGSKEIHLRKGTKIDYGIFTPDQKETLDVVWDAYSRYDTKFLERLKTPSEELSVEGKNSGKLILDATCTPADIHYPTDL